MGRRRFTTSAVVLLLSMISAATAQIGNGPVTYVYDDLGRLVGAIDAQGNAAIYSYDAVGNILSISRISSGQASIVGFSPTSGPAGTAVTINGTGFSVVATQDAVYFNGTPATILSASTTQIVARVPSSATTGKISITSPRDSLNK